MKVMTDIFNEIDARKDEVFAIRRYIHQHPEIGFATQKTQAFIQDFLEIEGMTCISVDAGLIAELKVNEKEQYIAFRADMDALPIEEKNTHAFVSQEIGKMHACGHDGHTAILMETAKILKRYKKYLNYNILFLFQSAEEGPYPGGGLVMVEDLKKLGYLEKIKVCFACHITTEYEVSKFGIRYQNAMASTDEFKITLKGKGGHPASPHLNIDAISLSAQFIHQMESFMLKGIDPLIPSVLSIGKIQGGTAKNIVSDTCIMEGTIRNQNEETRANIIERMKAILEGLKVSTACDFDLDIVHGLPVLMNDDRAIALVEKIIDTYGSEEQKIILREPAMGAEDFSFYAERMPVAFVWLGAGFKEDNKNFHLHNPHFDFHEDALLYGVKLFASLAINYKSN